MKSHLLFEDSLTTNINNIQKSVSTILSQLINYTDEDTIFEIKVVLNEILNNAIVHGNDKRADKNIFIKSGVSKDNFWAIIKDDGKGFNYCFCKDKKNSNLSDCGRGLKIINTLCDNVKVNNEGNKFVVLKKL